MHDQQREEAIARLLRFRDDLPQSDLFVILWNVCLNTQVHALTTFCQQTLNPLLVQSLVQRPSSLRVASLLQNELRGTQQAPQGNSRAPPDDARRRNEEQQRRQQDDQRQREYQRQQQQRQQEQEQRKQQEDERQREYQRQQQQRQQQQDHRQQEQREQQEDEQKQHPKTKRRFCPTTQKMREWIDNGAGRKKSQQILKRMDLNHDGMISQIEAIKACKKNSQDAADIGLPLGNIRQEGGTRNVFQSVFNEIDTNGDKQLDEVELLYQLWNMHKAKQN
jgi:acetyl/propionyl-CoA carboxylase alpha subunit